MSKKVQSLKVAVQCMAMTSKEIADLTGKEHRNVLADIRKMILPLINNEDCNLHAESYYFNKQNRPQPCIKIPLVSALTLVSGYDTESRFKIFSRLCKDRADILDAINEFEVPDDLPDLFLYAIRNTVTGNVKLGISRNPEERLKQLQIGNDCKLELVGYQKADNRFEDEKQLHVVNGDHHLRGEWFSETAILH